ncbi:MAG: glycosyltransferase family 2 protein [Xanthobacteraceae bacterium]|nr:glycosyltransferase family 2 protein [Xanthobacteraceae bacterium]
MRGGISVVIPVYNGARYLSECIESVRNQILPAADIIVVDDGSEDDTPKVAAGWGDRIRYERISHGGAARARNHGIRLVATDILALVDSDDIWLPGKLDLQVAALSREDGPAMVFGHMEQFVSSDLTPEEAAGFKFNPAPLPGIAASTLVIRQSDFDRVGPFDESLATGEFIEWNSRARDLGIKTVLVPDVVCRRRLHRGNMGRGGAAIHGTSYLRMLKQVLDRRRP